MSDTAAARPCADHPPPDTEADTGATPATGPHHSRELLAQVAALPALPGVYRYFDAAGALLYVGKARNLHRRVGSYFQKDHGPTRIGHMVRQIARLQTTVVRTETEALLLENNLIKTARPKYNIVFRDDKSYPYLQLSGQPLPDPNPAAPGGPLPPAQIYPRLAYYRGATDRKNRYFGPFPNVWAVKETIDILQKVFRLRTCEDTVFSNRSRPCLLFQIKRCTAPCTGEISAADYAADVEHAQRLLQGQAQSLPQQLQQRMAQLAQRMEYEQAAVVRDQIAALASVMQQQHMDMAEGVPDADIIAVRLGGGRACVNLAMVRAGRHLGDHPVTTAALAHALPEALHPDARADAHADATPGTPDADAQARQVLNAFLAQHYLGLPAPAVLITSHPADAVVLEALSQQHGHRITATHQPRGQRRAWLQMCDDNAALHLSRVLAEEGSQRERTLALVQALGLDAMQAASPGPSAPGELAAPPDSDALQRLRIECFDISHTAGEHTQAACVVFHGHRMQPREYRRYRISGITPGDDYAAMRQALLRRYRPLGRVPQSTPDDGPVQGTTTPEHVAHEGMTHEGTAHDGPEAAPGPRGAAPRRVDAAPAPLPDLVLIDGGKGQVGIAREVFTELGLPLSRIVGVEKGQGRRVGLEELVFADGREKIWLGADSPALMLVAHIRDEAHRFAITGMRAARARARTGQSSLQDIPGVGPRRRALLLQHFGGARGVAGASVQELMQVPGISATLAQTIYQALR